MRHILKPTKTLLLSLAAAVTLVAMSACGSGEQTDRPETASRTPTVVSNTPGGPANLPPSTDMSIPGDIDTAARQLLAEEVGEGDFMLVSSERMQWFDASLGCPKEGMMYAQVITPGYKLAFDFAGTSYAVHSNSDGSHIVICGDGQ